MNEKRSLAVPVPHPAAVPWRIVSGDFRGGIPPVSSIYDRQKDPCYGRKEETMQTKMNVKSVSAVGILVAMEIILARFSIHTWNIKIGFSFVPIVVAAILYGPVAGGLVGAIGDVMSAIMFPVGAYFPGFTLTAYMTGVAFGLCFQKKVTVCNVILSVLIVQGVISQFLNTYWISFLYGSPYWLLFGTRIYQTIVLSVVQAVSILLIDKKLIPVLKREF